MFIVHCFISSERKLLKETKKVEHKDTRACIIYTFYSYERVRTRGRILHIPFFTSFLFSSLHFCLIDGTILIQIVN